MLCGIPTSQGKNAKPAKVLGEAEKLNSDLGLFTV